MTDNEKIQSLGDMVDTTDRMFVPWRETVFKLGKALVLINLLWAIVLGLFIWFAYMAPDTTYQTQEFDGHQQVQSSGTEVATQGRPQLARQTQVHRRGAKSPRKPRASRRPRNTALRRKLLSAAGREPTRKLQTN